MDDKGILWDTQSFEDRCNRIAGLSVMSVWDPFLSCLNNNHH